MDQQQQQEDAAWDELFVDPQRTAFDAGQEAGRQAGLDAGYKDGLEVGVVTGMNHGMEVGFIRGVLQEVERCLEEHPDAFGDASKIDRIQQTVESLSERLQAFPSPREVFQQGISVPHAGEEALPGDDSEQADDASDLQQKLQGIRSKFKLLTVQLKWPNYSLKTTLDEASTAPLPTNADESGGGKEVDW